MRKEIMMMIKQQPEIKRFLRFHPHWYRTLGRDPSQWKVLEKEAARYFGKTFPQRVEKINHSMNLALMVMDMLRAR